MLNRRSLILAGSAAIATVRYGGLPSSHDIVLARSGLAIGPWPEGGRGLRVSFAAVGSTSGWLTPTRCFQSRGIDPKTFLRCHDGASHPANVIAVANGQVDLATDFDGSFNGLAERSLDPSGDSALGRG